MGKVIKDADNVRRGWKECEKEVGKSGGKKVTKR